MKPAASLKKFSSILFVCGAWLMLAVLVLPAWASSPPALRAAGSTVELDAGNYCWGCHIAGDDRLASATAWRGGIESTSAQPCPALASVQEELFYTERLLLAIDRAQASLPLNETTQNIKARLLAAQDTYQRLLDTPVASLDAFVSEAQVLRYRLGKSYTQLNALIDARKSRWSLLGGVGVTLVILASLAWGWRNARRLSGPGVAATGGRLSWKSGLIVLLGFLLFALPIFRTFSPAAVVASAEAQEIQAILDEVGRSADAADRALARAWMLGRVAAAWAPLDPEGATEALQTALAGASEAHIDAAALWGDSLAAQEAAIGSEVDQRTAALLAGEIDAAQMRVWHLRQMAVEWMPVDPQLATALLQLAEVAVGRQSGLHHDLDLRAIAVIWAGLDPQQTMRIMESVTDPAVRAWGYRDIGARHNVPELLSMAAETASEIQDPVVRAYHLTEIGRLNQDTALFAAAAEALAEVNGATRDFALARLAASAGDPEIARQVELPAAQALAWLGLEDYEAAWEAAARIENPYDRARAETAIATRQNSAERAAQVSLQLFRDRALRDVTLATGEASLAEEIQRGYDRVQVYTDLGYLDVAQQAAQSGLGDTYPLVELGIALAKEDPDAARALVELMDREVDKSPVLSALAAAGESEEEFEGALGMAYAARVRGDALAPAENSLRLALRLAQENPTWAQAAFEQAYEAAQRIATK